MTELTVKTNKGFGWRPDIPDFRDLDFNSPGFKASRNASQEEALTSLEEELPVSLVIPEYKLPRVFDQRKLGSCVGQSISTMMTYVRKVTIRSRLYIYYEARRLIGETDKDEGCYIRDGIKVISNLGAPRESIWPYRESEVFVDPPVNVDKDAINRKIFKYARLNTRDDFRNCIAEGFPFVIGFSVYDSFNSRLVAKTGVQRMPARGESLQGGHAVCVIGYNSNFRETKWAQDAIGAGVSNVPNDVYIVRNSWGTDWGRKGDFAIDASYLENPNLAADAWTIRNN